MYYIIWHDVYNITHKIITDLADVCTDMMMKSN